MSCNTKHRIQDKAKTARDASVGPETRCEPRIVSRNDFLLTAGAIAVIAGLVFPLSGHILDVLLIFSISLTAAVLIITLSAREASEVSGFPLLIVLSTALRMALSVACAKLILFQCDGGTIINALGQLAAGGNVMLTILVFCLPATIILRIVCKAVKGISHSVAEFGCGVAAMRELSIDSDLGAGAINKEQATNLRAIIARERRFFAAMNSAAKFMRCDAVIELLIIIANIVISTAIGVAASTSVEITGQMYVALAVGAGIVTQLSVLIAAVSAEHLVRKSATAGGFDTEGRVSRRIGTERIKVAASEVVVPERAEPQYCKTTIPIDDAIMIESRFIESNSTETGSLITGPGTDPNEEFNTADFKRPDESQNAGSYDNKDDLSLWACKEIEDSTWYKLIAELIESKSTDEVKTILMAAENGEELPVTVPVNVAMCLAQKNKRCLLIDLDFERGAISRVFEIDSVNISNDRQAKAIVTDTAKGEKERFGIPTCIGNLCVWPGNNCRKADEDTGATNLRELTAELESRYDRLIIYAPNIRLLSDWKDVAKCTKTAILFGENGPKNDTEQSCIGDFHELLISCGSEVLKPTEVLAEAA